MSTKTNFKRIALVAVAALGLGVLSVAPSQAGAPISETLTLSSTASSVVAGDTAAVTMTHQWTASAMSDSVIVTIACTAPTGGACPTLGNTSGTTLYWTAAPDSSTTTNMSSTSFAASTYTDSSLAAGVVRSVVGLKMVTTSSTAVGAYLITATTKSAGAGGSYVNSNATITWTVTVTTDNLTVTGLTTYFSSDEFTSASNRKAFRASSDSAIVVDKGTAGTATAVGYITAAAINSASETSTAYLGNICTTTTPTKTADYCSIAVQATGGAQVAIKGGTAAISTTMLLYNNSTLAANGESLTVYSTGTAGTGTLTFTSGGVTIKTLTLTFTGSPASATSPSLSDTIVVKGQSSVVLSAIVKDASVALKSGTVYLYSSDTRVAGATLSTGTNANNSSTCSYSTTLSRFSCAVSVNDTGTATLYIRDSWTVAASTWVSAGIGITVTSDVMAAATVSFDKATYTPGERAVITITGTDVNARNLAAATYTGAFTSVVLTGPSVTDVSTVGLCGTNCSTSYSSLNFVGLADTGVETRVVTMPNVGGDISIAYKFPTLFSTVGGGTQTYTTVTASAKVVDAQAAATAAAVAAAKDASDAATDAALEATDAAYAATDAANIAAEAADAATAAAEAATEAANAAKESADAATAAVEELATSVAKLMAALQAQITNLAKVVAKIAVKVKA